MKKFSLLLIALLGLSFLSALAPLAGSNSTTEVITGASADLDYVYTDGEDTDDVTTAAEKNDDANFSLFGGDEEDSEYLYMGSKSPFDEVFFTIEGDAQYEDGKDAELSWQYNDGDSWQTLDVNDDTIDNFSKIGTYNVIFDLPSDWEKFEFEDNNAYWIRVRADEESTKSAKIDQVSARVFNLEVTVINDKGSSIKNLDSSNFQLGEGTDTHIYAVEDNGDGSYLLALQTEMSDTDYMLAVSVDGYLDQGFNVNDINTETQSYKVQLTPDNGCQTPFQDIDFHWGKTAITDLYCRGIIEGEQGNYMVNHTITRAEFLKMAIMNAAIDTSKYDDFSVPFSDVEESEWYYKYVATAYRLDAIDEDNHYYPNQPISRVEALMLLVRLAGVDTDETATRFSDIYRSDWFASTVRVATDYDVVEGYPDGTFKPERNLSRAEAAVMVNNAYRAWVMDN
jgi:hypothetical protein